MIDWTKTVTDFDVGSSRDGVCDIVFGMRNGLLHVETSCHECRDGRGKGATCAVNVGGGDSVGRECGMLYSVCRFRE